MGTRLRPWTTYKAFGGVLAVLGLPASILVALGDTPPGGGPAAPLTAAALPGLLGLAGLYVFLASDRAVKRIEAASPKTVRPHVTASTTRVSRPEPTTSFRRTESHRSTTPAQAHDCADIRGVCGSAASAPSRCEYQSVSGRACVDVGHALRSQYSPDEQASGRERHQRCQRACRRHTGSYQARDHKRRHKHAERVGRLHALGAEHLSQRPDAGRRVLVRVSHVVAQERAGGDQPHEAQTRGSPRPDSSLPGHRPRPP